MNKGESVELRDILSKSRATLDIKADQTYQEVTVRLWGKGVVPRRQVKGSEIAANKRFVVRNGQLILSRIDARNGAFGIVPVSLEGAVVTNDFPVFDVDSSKVNPSFLYWITRTAWFINTCRIASEGTTNRVRLKEERFLSSRITIPPIGEQQRIVETIEHVNQTINNTRNLNKDISDQLDAALNSIYHELIAEASYKPMAEVAPLVRRAVEIDASISYPELGVRSFGKGTFHKAPLEGSSVGTKKLFRIHAGDLVFNIVFAWEGAVAVARAEDDGRFGSHRFLTCVPTNGLATATFLRYHFLTEEGLRQLGEASPGGAGRNRTLGLKALASLSVPIPKFENQLWFDMILKKCDQINYLKENNRQKGNSVLSAILEQTFGT